MSSSGGKHSVLVVLRSSIIGALATLVDLVALVALIELLGVHQRVASLPALTLGVGVQFVGNKLFAFGDRSSAWLHQGAQFLGVEAIGFALNLALFDLVLTHTQLPFLPVRLATTSAVYLFVCLPLWGRIFHADPIS